MDEALNEDIGRLYGRHGRAKVQGFFKKIANNNKEIPATNNRRAMLNFLKASYTPDVIISESFLRSDVKLSNTSTITFSVNESDGAAGQQLSTTVRLNQNDTFEVTDLSFLIFTHDTTSTLSPATDHLFTYPNASVFNTANEAANLYALYSSGQLNITIGVTNIFQKWDVLRAYRVPITQEGVAVSSVAGTGVIKFDAFEREMMPFCPLAPTITISGNGKNSFVINLPQGVDFRPASGTRENYVVLFIRGFLCANGAKQMNKKFSP